MTYLLVGMLQGAVMPRNQVGLEGVATHGIDSCTGLVLISENHIFLAHMPPAPTAHAPTAELMAYRKQYTGAIDKALSRMSGKLTRAIIVSPNTERELPNGGPVVIGNTLKTVYGIETEKELGTKVTVAKGGAVAIATGGAIANTTAFKGGTDDKWVTVYVN